MSKFVEDISPPDNEGNTKPLILFIDELDRCRPNFAIELLEKAKHFFNIDNIIFILAIDKEQLGHSIRSMYGVGMNVDGYLRRFINLDYNLPEPSTDAFCNALFDKLELTNHFTGQTGVDKHKELLSTLKKLFKAFNFSLRDQEQCSSRLSIVLKTTPQNHHMHPAFLATLITLKISNQTLYTNYIKGYSAMNEIITYIGNTPEGKTLLNSHCGNILEAYFAYAQCDRVEKRELINKYEITSKDDSTSEDEKHKAHTICKISQHLDFEYDYNILEYLTKKIEIAEDFTQK